MAELIAEVAFQDSDGLPKDRFENVFHFNTEEVGLEADWVSAAGQVVTFYTDATEGAQPLGAYLSPVIQPRIGVVKIYDRADAIPRPIKLQATFVIANSTGSGGIPEEVALCLSYYTDRNLPSHRGRMYIGPLASGALNEATVRPATAFVTAMADAGTRLIEGTIVTSSEIVTSWDPHGADITDPPVAPSDTCVWALFSPKHNTSVAIQHGWVDNEWDGQRRRRVAATTRVSYPPA